MARILPRKLRMALFQGKEHYEQFRQRWRWLTNSHDAPKLGPEHYLIAAAFRGRDWREGFTPMTNKVKVGNGQWGAWGARRALGVLAAPATRASKQNLLASFDGLLTPEMLDQLMKLLPGLGSVDGKEIFRYEIEDPYPGLSETQRTDSFVEDNAHILNNLARAVRTFTRDYCDQLTVPSLALGDSRLQGLIEAVGVFDIAADEVRQITKRLTTEEANGTV